MQKLKQQQFFDRILEKLPDHITLLLVILSGFLLARLTWMLFPADPSLSMAVKDAPTQAMEVIPAKASSQDLSREIAAYHLLGTYTPPVNPQPEVAAAPEPAKPQLPMKLVGLYSLPGKSGIAIIDVNGKQHVLSVGETIKDTGIKLVKVYDEKVDVSVAGKKQTLEMQKLVEVANRGGADGQSMAPPEMVPEMTDQPMVDNGLAPPMEDPNFQQAEMVPPPEGQPVGNPVDAAAGGTGGVESAPEPQEQPATPPAQPQTSNTLTGFREQVASDNNKLLEIVRPSPVIQNGQMQGFRVAPGSNIALFNQTGLQAGDIVTEINGNALNSNSSSLRAMQGLMQSSNAQLKVLRGGQLTSVQVSF